MAVACAGVNTVPRPPALPDERGRRGRYIGFQTSEPARYFCGV
jgi:hypothetical protein